VTPGTHKEHGAFGGHTQRSACDSSKQTQPQKGSRLPEFSVPKVSKPNECVVLFVRLNKLTAKMNKTTMIRRTRKC
jgi:hypothetical protein